MRWKKGGSCINLENGGDVWSRKTRAHASLLGCDGGRRPIQTKGVVLVDEESRLCGQQGANMTSPRLQSHPADSSKTQIPTPFVWESAFLHLCFCTYNFYFFD